MVDRNKKLAIIHIARKQLGLDDDSYRAVLSGAAGIESAKDIKSEDQYRKILHTFKKLGFRYNKKKIQDKQLAKCYAIWTDLHKLGAVQEKKYAALMSWIKRQLGTEQDILTGQQKSHIIEELKAWRERVEGMR